MVRQETKAQTLEEVPRVKKVGAGTLVAVHQGWRVDTQVDAHLETRVGDVQADDLVGDCPGWMDGTLAAAHREKKAHILEVVHQDWREETQVEGRLERKVDTLVEACRGWMARVHCPVGPSRKLASSTACRENEKAQKMKVKLESENFWVKIRKLTVRFSTLPQKEFPCN